MARTDPNQVRLAHFVAVTPAAARLRRELQAAARLLEKVKRRLFATMMSTAKPAGLDAALRERRATLEKKHGAPVRMPAEIASAARMWEGWCAKQGRC